MTGDTRPRAADDAEDRLQIRGSTLLLAGSVVTAAIDFGAQVVLVRYLTKDAFGAWSYALAVAILIASVAQFEMRNSVSRFVPALVARGDPGRARGAIATAIATAFGLGVAGTIVLFAAVGLFGLRPTADPLSLKLMLLIGLVIPLLSIDAVFTGIFASFGDTRTIFVRQSVVAPLLRLALVVGVVLISGPIELLAAGYVLATAIGVLLYVGRLRRVLQRPEMLADRTVWSLPLRDLFTFAAPLLTSTLVWALIESSDAVLLGYFFDATTVANFRVVLPLVRMNALVSGVFSLMFVPLAARAIERGAELRTLYWRTALWMTALTFPILVATVSFAPAVTAGLYGERYAASAPIMALLSSAYFVNTALGFNGLTLKVLGRLRYTVSIDIIAAVANVALNLLLIPRFGVFGAAIGSAATLVGHNVLKQIGLRRYAGFDWFPRQLVRPYAGLLAIVAVLAAIQLVTNANLLIAAVLTGVGAVAGLLWCGRLLEAEAPFPELKRVGLVRRLRHFGRRLPTMRRPAARNVHPSTAPDSAAADLPVTSKPFPDNTHRRPTEPVTLRRRLALLVVGVVIVLVALIGAQLSLGDCSGRLDDPTCLAFNVASPGQSIGANEALPAPQDANPSNDIYVNNPPLLPTPVGQTPIPTAGVDYLFDDEFNGSGLSDAWGRHWGTLGTSRLSSSQSAVHDGILTITAQRSDSGVWVTDLLDTFDSFRTRYGHFEARAKVPEGRGFWASFWLAEDWASSRMEFDVMEVCANPPGAHEGNDVTVVHQIIHFADGGPSVQKRVHAGNVSDDWHVYGLDWRPDQVVFYVDGVETLRFNDASRIPDDKAAVILSLEVGGWCGKPTDSTPDSADLQVDWVRVTP